MKRGSLGDTVVVRYQSRERDVVAEGYLMTCIEDSPERLVLFFPHGTSFMGFCHLPPKGRADRVANPLPSRRREPQIWQNHTLRFLYPGEAYQIWALWRGDSWDFVRWYVNLEAPFVRTVIGVDARDHALDIVALPSLEWRWKDEDELAASVDHGIDTPGFAEEVRTEGRRVIERIERAASPFGAPWPDWRPDPVCRAPELLDGWTDVPAVQLWQPGA
jgi:hypothetical protein